MHIPHTADPHRSPDWRSRRCQGLVECGKPPSPSDDAATRAGWAYSTRLSRCREDEQREAVAREYPQLHAAHTLRGRTDDFRRVGVEGYLLARALPEEADTRFGLS